ncbi:ABC transporter substrate-binding protein [Moraxella sp. Tifton1]|nr:ABC transporter substrate-binding protein [Moraxella sp. Tifton1]MCL1623525.1 ABC transporter substrate-binding protein [Moraxella sp. Tifton1]
MKLTLNPLFAGLMAASFLMTGCGSEKSASSGANSTISTNKIADVVIVNASEPASLDPQKASDAPSFAIQRQMFLGLTASDANGKTVPSMATEWQSVDDTVWTFKLRTDVKWSDGTPVTAQDFVYALQRLTDPQTAAPYGAYLVDAKVVNAQAISQGKAQPNTLGVKALDDHTLQIITTEPVPYLPDLMLLPATFATPKQAIEKYGNKWTDPANIVVDGAYKLDDWKVNSHIILKRNESYFDDAKTKINSVAFLPMSAQAAMSRYKAGEVDFSAAPSEMFKELKAEMPNEVVVTPMLCTSYLEYNTKKAPLDDVRVRTALSMSLDRDLITKEVLGRGEESSYQLTPYYTQGMTKVVPDWAKLPMAERAKMANDLLAQAGYSQQKPAKIEILYSTSEAGKRLTSAILSLYKQYLPNANISIINQEWKMFLDTRDQGNFQMAAAAWCADYNEPSTFLNIMRTGNSNNTSFYSNLEYDRLLDSTLSAGATNESRQQAYVEAEKILQKDAAIMPMYTLVSPSLIKTHLKGINKDDPLKNWLVKDWEITQ